MLIDDLIGGNNKINKEDIFKMDTFLDNLKILKGLKKKTNEYPNLGNMIESYKIRLNEIFIKHKGRLGNKILESVGENPYQRTIELPVEGEYYNLIWNIDKLIKIIYEKKIKRRPFLVSKLIKTVDDEGIDVTALENAKRNKQPIIVGYFPQLQHHYIVLDGNHRVKSRYQRHKMFVMGYELSPEYVTKGLVVDIFKELFIMHLNMYAVLKYIGGYINEKQLKQQIIPLINDFY